MIFKPDHKFNSSHKMDEAKISLDKALKEFGEGDTECEKVEHLWSGSFTAKDGTVMRAAFWDWKGGLRMGFGVSIWVDKPEYLPEFKQFIEA